jgi:hypothetical protein
MATRYGVDGPGIEFRLGRDFPYRPWGPPRLLYNWYRISVPGVKRPARGIDHPPSSSAEVEERVQLWQYSPSGSVLTWNLPVTFMCVKMIRGITGIRFNTSGFVLLGCGLTLQGGWCPRFWNSVFVASWRVKCPMKEWRWNHVVSKRRASVTQWRSIIYWKNEDLYCTASKA